MTIYVDKIDGERIEVFNVGSKDTPQWYFDAIGSGKLIQHIDLEESRKQRKNVGLKVEIVDEEDFILEGDYIGTDSNGWIFGIDKDELLNQYEEAPINEGSVILTISDVNGEDMTMEKLNSFMVQVSRVERELGINVTGSATLVPKQTIKVD